MEMDILGFNHQNSGISANNNSEIPLFSNLLADASFPLMSKGNNMLPSSNLEGAHDPLIGIIDSGFSASHPDLNYHNLILGSDRIDNDRNPLSSIASETEHGTSILGIIGATRNNNLGIDGINDRAKIWLSRAIGSGKWADSVIEFVDKAKSLNQKNAVLNLSFELTQINPDGSVTPRSQLTSAELAALDYARRNQVIIVAAAGNSGIDQMSALGQAARLFENIITVGAADGYRRADYSNYGQDLDILAQGGTLENPVFSLTSSNLDGITATSGTSIATAKVTGAISQIWGINSDLNYTQVLDILKHSAKDIGKSGWDADTGYGLLNIGDAVKLAQNTQSQPYLSLYDQRSLSDVKTWSGDNGILASERGVGLLNVVNTIVKPVVNTVVKPVVNTLQQQIDAGKKTISTWIGNGQNDLKNFGSDLSSLINTARNKLNGLSSYGSFADSLNNEISNLYNNVFKTPIDNARTGLNSLNLTAAFNNILNQGEKALNSLYDKWFASDIAKLTKTVLGKNYNSLLSVSNAKTIRTNPLSALQLIVNNKSFDYFDTQAQGILEQLKATSASDFVNLFSANNNNSIIKAWNGISALQKSGIDLLKTVTNSYQTEKNTFFNAINSANAAISKKKETDVNALNGVIKTINANYSKASNDAYDQFNSLIIGDFNKKLTEAKSKIPDINNLINQGRNRINGQIGSLKSGFDVTYTSANKIINTLSNNINSKLNWANGVADKVWNNLPGLSQLAGEKVSKYNSFYSDYLSNPWKNNGLNPFNTLNSNNSTSYSTAVNRWNKLVSSFNNGSYDDAAVNLANSGIDSLNTIINSALSSTGISSKIEGFRSELVKGTYIKKAWDTALTATKTVDKLIYNAFTSASGEVGKLSDTLNSAIGQVDKQLLDITNKIAKWGTDLDRIISQKFQDFQSQLKTTTQQALKDAENAGQTIDRAIQDSAKTVQQLEDIINNPQQFTKEVLETAKKTLEPAKQLGKWIEDNVAGPALKQAFEWLEKNANPLSLGLKLVPNLGFNLEIKWTNDWSPMVHKILGSVENSTIKTVDSLVYILEGKYQQAWSGIKDIFNGSIGKLFDAGKQAVKGDWQGAVKNILSELNIDIPQSQANRFLTSSNPIQDGVVKALTATGISLKTAEAALDGIGGVDNYSDDAQAHGIFDILGYYNIPIVSWIAKAANMGYYVAQATKDFANNPEQGVKRILTGNLSIVSVQNAADWVDAAFSLKDAITTKDVNKDPYYIKAVGSVLEAINISHGKNWVEGAYDLYNAINDTNKYSSAIANLIIAAADIDGKSKQDSLKAWANNLWKVVNNPQSTSTVIEDYLKGEAKTQLKSTFSMNDNQADQIIYLVGYVRNKKYDDALNTGFNLAGFGTQGNDLFDAFKYFQAKKYGDALTKIVGAVGSPQASKFIEVGNALRSITFDLNFDRPKQDALIAILNSIGTNNSSQEVGQMN